MVSGYGQSSQKRVLLQQIAALKVYGDYVQKGYSIAKKGLRTISDVKDGELNLHSLFYTALKTVNPGVRNYEKVAAIIALQVKIFGQYNAMSGLLYDDLFYGDEQDYIERVFARLLEDCDANLVALTDLITDTFLEMSDADRLARIDALYGQMLDNYSFSRHFADQAIALKKAREREHKDINSSKSLYHPNQQP
jgi:hypothetical protein